MAATKVHTILVDSRDREAPTATSPSAYRVTLPLKLRRVVSARLVSAEVPSSFYVFRAEYGNTSLRVLVNSVAHDITIPDGNYTASQMALALRTALNEAFAPLAFNAAVSKTTLKLSIQNLDGFDVSVDTTATAAAGGTTAPVTEWGLGYYLGFRKDEVVTGAVVTGSRVMSTNPYTYLVLDIEELNGSHEGGNGGATPMASHGCFAKIPFSANSFEYVFMDARAVSDKPATFSPPIATLDRLRVRFRFHDGRLVNFDDLEHSFTLELVTKEPAAAVYAATDQAAVLASQTADATAHMSRMATQVASAASSISRAVSSAPSSLARPPAAHSHHPSYMLPKAWLFFGAALLAVVYLFMVRRRLPGS